MVSVGLDVSIATSSVDCCCAVAVVLLLVVCLIRDESLANPLATLGDAHKYVWLASPDRPDFFSKVRVGWSASIKSEKKLKAFFSSVTC